MAVREDIINEALTLFAENGYDSVGVAKIVEAVHVTKPSLYHYFGSKEGLLNSILESYFNPFLDGLSKVTLYQEDIVLTIERVTIHYISFYKAYPVFYQLSKHLHYSPAKSHSYEILKPYREREFERLSQLFTAIANHHTGFKEKEVGLTFSYLGMIDAYASYHIEQNTLKDTHDNDYRLVAKQFLYGIFSL
jgi:TetR/AcrR family transcriptional regulator